MLAKGIAKSGREIAYIAPTFTEARDIAWRSFLQIAEPSICSTNESRLEIKVNSQDGGTSIIYFKSWETVASLRGMQFDYLVLDEVAQYREFWPQWYEDLEPTLLPRNGEALFISTPLGFNHFYDLFNKENESKEYKSFRFTSYKNPHLSRDWLDEKQRNTPEDSFQQEYNADFRKTTGLVYREFRREKHVVHELPTNFIKKIAGLDFGYTNPSCILLIGVDYDNNYWVMSEWYKTQQTNEQIAQYCQYLQPNEVYPDPERPEGIVVLNKFGLNVREVHKGKDSVEAGIQRVRELFKQNRIKVYKTCENLIWELETYRYQEKQPEQNIKEVPVKENDHAVDALRYALYTVNLKRMPKIRKPRPQYEGVRLRMTNY
jgi:PBSX family phage terminase large subunit